MTLRTSNREPRLASCCYRRTRHAGRVRARSVRPTSHSRSTLSPRIEIKRQFPLRTPDVCQLRGRPRSPGALAHISPDSNPNQALFSIVLKIEPVMTGSSFSTMFYRSRRRSESTGPAPTTSLSAREVGGAVASGAEVARAGQRPTRCSALEIGVLFTLQPFDIAHFPYGHICPYRLRNRSQGMQSLPIRGDGRAGVRIRPVRRGGGLGFAAARWLMLPRTGGRVCQRGAGCP